MPNHPNWQTGCKWTCMEGWSGPLGHANPPVGHNWGKLLAKHPLAANGRAWRDGVVLIRPCEPNSKPQHHSALHWLPEPEPPHYG